MFAIIGMSSWRLAQLSYLVTVSGNFVRNGTSSGNPEIFMQPLRRLLTGLLDMLTLEKWIMQKNTIIVGFIGIITSAKVSQIFLSTFFLSFFLLTTILHNAFCMRFCPWVRDHLFNLKLDEGNRTTQSSVITTMMMSGLRIRGNLWCTNRFKLLIGTEIVLFCKKNQEFLSMNKTQNWIFTA